MIFITTWLIALFTTTAFGDSIASGEKFDAKVEVTTNANLIRSTVEKAITDNNSKLKDTRNGKTRENDKSDLSSVKDISMEQLFLLEKEMDEIDKITEGQQQSAKSKNVENKADDTDNNPVIPIESKLNKDFIGIRREETNSNVNQENSIPAVQFDDSKTEVTSDPPQRYGQRSRKFQQRFQDGAPLLQLTQGGYERPYKRLRYRDRYSPKPDSSEQSENVQQPDKASNKVSDSRRIAPQVSYVSSPQLPYALGHGPLMNHQPFDSPARNLLAMNQILPPPAQSGFLNPHPADFISYSTPSFQPQFLPSNAEVNFQNNNRNPSNAGRYQTFSNNPYQTPGILFQNSPQVQPQPILIDTRRNIPNQYQQTPLSTYSGSETVGDTSTPTYATFFRSPAVNAPFQVPPDFYGNTPNAINPFSNPPISFLSQYPNFDTGLQSQFYRYPDTNEAQNSRQSPNSQQVVSDVSQDENKVIIQNADDPVNRGDAVLNQFDTNIQPGNVEDVYMRYPTVEAGYAVAEKMPTQNKSEESKDNSKQSSEEETDRTSSDPYKNILNSVRGHQRINSSFDFPPEVFRSAPIDFGYQRPPSGIFLQYPDGNRGLTNYRSREFEPRIPFNTIASLPENFHSGNHQLVQQESNETPLCAKHNNASVCFEDNDYPKSDILYTLNSNSFLTDRLLNPDPSLNSFAFVERNGNETGQNEENYACDVATKYGTPLRLKNLAGMWRIIVNVQGKFSQPVRMEVCKTLGSSCSYSDTVFKTSCVQKFSLQRLLTWSPSRGIYSDVYKIPVACSCQITQTVGT